jgi:cell envelope opacity-associated protein A
MDLQRSAIRRSCGPMIPVNLRAALSIIILPALLASCGSSPRVRGAPRKLPVIDLHGSAQTPAHSMEKKSYPFNADGDYMTAWASNGSASEHDNDSWSSSHDGSVSKRNPSPVRKVSSSPSKKKTVTSSKSKSGSSKGASRSYVIKRGDTLGAIAQRNGTTVSKIKAANGMSSDKIREGKSLKIP